MHKLPIPHRIPQECLTPSTYLKLFPTLERLSFRAGMKRRWWSRFYQNAQPDETADFRRKKLQAKAVANRKPLSDVDRRIIEAGPTLVTPTFKVTAVGVPFRAAAEGLLYLTRYYGSSSVIQGAGYILLPQDQWDSICKSVEESNSVLLQTVNCGPRETLEDSDEDELQDSFDTAEEGKERYSIAIVSIHETEITFKKVDTLTARRAPAVSVVLPTTAISPGITATIQWPPTGTPQKTLQQAVQAAKRALSDAWHRLAD